MSQFRDLIARMAIDPEFARLAVAEPEVVASQYGLTAREAEQLRHLVNVRESAGPAQLGARISKMGGALAAALDPSALDFDLGDDDPPPKVSLAKPFTLIDVSDNSSPEPPPPAPPAPESPAPEPSAPEPSVPQAPAPQAPAPQALGPPAPEPQAPTPQVVLVDVPQLEVEPAQEPEPEPEPSPVIALSLSNEDDGGVGAGTVLLEGAGMASGIASAVIGAKLARKDDKDKEAK